MLLGDAFANYVSQSAIMEINFPTDSGGQKSSLQVSARLASPEVSPQLGGCGLLVSLHGRPSGPLCPNLLSGQQSHWMKALQEDVTSP